MPGQEDIEVTCDLITGKFNTCTYIRCQPGANHTRKTCEKKIRKLQEKSLQSEFSRQ